MEEKLERLDLTKTTRRQLLKGSATVGMLGIGAGVNAAEKPLTSAGDGKQKPGKDVEPHEGGGSVGIQSNTRPRDGSGHLVLIIKDCNPWYAAANEYALAEMGVPYVVINSNMVTDENLDAYSAIVLPSTQSRIYYQRLAEQQGKLAQYVENGGTLVGHIGDGGYPCYGGFSGSVLPEGVGHTLQYYDNVSVVAESHPVLDGLSGSALDSWNYSTHGYLTDVPTDATLIYGVVGNPTGKPTYVEYRHGDGRVLATTHTIEWPWSQSYYGTKQLLRNELTYALYSESGQPSMGLDKLVDEKLTLAESIDSISQNISETPRVEATLDSITDQVEDGSLSEAAAEGAVKRMLLGENVTQATITAIGPPGDDGEYEADGFDIEIATPNNVESYDTAKIAVDSAISALVGILLSKAGLKRMRRILPNWATGAVDDALSYIDNLIADIVSVVLGAFNDVVRRVRGKAFAITDELQNILAKMGAKGKEKAATKLFDKISQVDTFLAGLLVGIFETETPDSLDEALVNLDEALGGDGTIDASGDLDDAIAEAQQGLDEVRDTANGAKEASDFLGSVTSFISVMEVIGVALAVTGVFATAAVAIELAALVVGTLFYFVQTLVGVGTVEEIVDIQNETLDGIIDPMGGV